jgi:hypothetical protein
MDLQCANSPSTNACLAASIVTQPPHLATAINNASGKTVLAKDLAHAHRLLMLAAQTAFANGLMELALAVARCETQRTQLATATALARGIRQTWFASRNAI